MPDEDETEAADEPEADDEETPSVELGEGATVDGAPLARIVSRLTWPQEKSEIVRKVGETAIRTPDGPQRLADVLDGVETTYFARRQEFVRAVRQAVGTGPVPTSE